ncbi:MAG: thioredoxin family protein [Nitrospiria bacterium]
MSKNRKIEIFSAGCPLCEEAVSLVMRLACPSCEISVLDMKTPVVVKKATRIGIGSVPSIVVDGRLSECCRQGMDEETLKQAGIGQSIGN